MATRVKKQSATTTTTSREIVATPETSSGKNDAALGSGTTASNETVIPKKVGRKPGVKKTVPLKAKARVGRKGNTLKINPKSLARVLMENGKGLGDKKILLKNGTKEVVRRTRKPKLPKIKQEPEEDGSPPVLEPIFPQEENLEVKKTAKKRGRPFKIPSLIDIKKEPVDEFVGGTSDGTELPALAPVVVKKKGRPKKIKVEPSMDEVMTDLSFLIEADQIKKESIDSAISEPSEIALKPKKLTKKQRLDLIKNDLIKKENLENTLSKLEPADVKIIDRLDLNVRKFKTDLPIKLKRRHSIEKFPISDSVEPSGDSLINQLSLFNQLPRSLSPKISKRSLKMGNRRYTTRSDSPARMLRNGKHRRLKDFTLLDGLDSPKRRKRVHSDLSETASKLSGYESDSSYSDMASLHGSEKDANKDIDSLLLDESSNQDPKTAVSSLGSSSTDLQPLIDTNSNVCDDSKIILKDLEELPISIKVPEKELLLDIMKQTFNDMNKSPTAKNNEILFEKPSTSTIENSSTQTKIELNEEEELRQLLEQTEDNQTKECIENIKSLAKNSSEEAPILEPEKDDSIPVIDNMSTAALDPPQNHEHLGPPLLESSIERPVVIKNKNEPKRSVIDENLGIAVFEKGNIVSFHIEHLSGDDIEEQETSNEDLNQSEKIEDVAEKTVEEIEAKSVETEEPKAKPEAAVEEANEGSNKIENNTEQEATIEEKLTEEKEDCDKTSETTNIELIEDKNPKEIIIVKESPEELAQKESILGALGLQSLRAAKEAPNPRKKSKASTSKAASDAYTGTLKTVIKINKKKGKNQFKMTLQKNKNKPDKTEAATSAVEDGYKITKESGSSSCKHNKDSSDTAGAHRKSHYSNRSNMENSSEHTSDSEQASHDKSQPEKSLIVPEKASSFSIHPGRLCKDECSYCFGKFGLFDTPCHIAQIKSVERQNKILTTEKHLTRDSCLCDACYRHVDRKSNSPSYINKSLKRNSLVAPGPRQNHCHVLGCNNVSTNILRRKWIIKMRKSICQVINIDLDNPGLHSIPICDEHYSALEHLMICAMCKRRLARNHIHYLGPEVKELNDALKDEGIPIYLCDKPVVCKLCKCFASIILKDPEERMENSVNFFREYKKRLLHFNDIVPMDVGEADAPIVAPGKSGTDKKDVEIRRKRMRNSSNESYPSESQDKEDYEEDDMETRPRKRVPSSDTNHSQSANQSRAQSPEDEYAEVDYNTLIPAIAMDCPSDNESKKDNGQKMVQPKKIVPKLESLGGAVEISRSYKKDNDLAAKKLGQNPSISLRPNYGDSSWQDEPPPPGKLISNPALSVRQLFPGEEEMGLAGNIDFKNVLTRTPEGWEKCVATIQYDEDTKMLWQELQKPYGSKSSFLRHLILLEKYFRNGDLVLSQSASHHAINYKESVHNRLRAYDNIPSGVGNVQPPSMVQFNKIYSRNMASQSSSNGLPPVTISQIGRGDNETHSSSRTPITLQQLNQPPLYPTSTMLQNLAKNKSSAAPPGLISIHQKSTASNVKPQVPGQKIKFPITKNWRPNLIPIDPTKKNERKPGLVQVISGGKPYHITLEDYKKMCAIKRCFEAKQKKIQEQQLLAKQQSLMLNHSSVLKTSVTKKGMTINKTSGGTVIENKPVSLVPISNAPATITSDPSESILEKLDKQVERLGQNASLLLEKNPAIQIIPRIPKSLTVIPQTVRKSPPSPVLLITKTSSNGSSSGEDREISQS